MLNDLTVRDAVVTAAAARFGYQVPQVELRLYVGKFAGALHERRVRDWCAQQSVGAGPVVVVNALDVVRAVRHVASSKQYRDNPVLATLKVLEATGAL